MKRYYFLRGCEDSYMPVNSLEGLMLNLSYFKELGETHAHLDCCVKDEVGNNVLVSSVVIALEGKISASTTGLD